MEKAKGKQREELGLGEFTEMGNGLEGRIDWSMRVVSATPSHVDGGRITYHDGTPFVSGMFLIIFSKALFLLGAAKFVFKDWS